MIRERDLDAAWNELDARMITEVSLLRSKYDKRHIKTDYDAKASGLDLALFQLRVVRKLRALKEGLHCLEWEKFKIER